MLQDGAEGTDQIFDVTTRIPEHWCRSSSGGRPGAIHLAPPERTTTFREGPKAEARPPPKNLTVHRKAKSADAGRLIEGGADRRL